MATVECDLCGGENFETISNLDRHGNPLETVMCEQCGLVQHAKIPTEQELQQFYATSYREAYNGERTPGARRIMRAWKNGERICRQVQPELQPNAKVFEVGAGIGCTVKVFEQAGFEASGIDPGGEFLNFSREKLSANVEVKNLYDLPDSHGYDAVLLVHVIEHLRSPARALRHIGGLLKPGGFLLVECPNLAAPFASEKRLFHSAHIFNFVPSTLKMLAESCGYQLHKRFGSEHDPNLQMLFKHTGNENLQIDAANCERTRAALNRSKPIRYFPRWEYVSNRVVKLTGYAQEHATAERFVSNLIDNCAVNAAPTSRAA